MRILSMDPGSPSYGMTVLDVALKGETLKVKIVGTGMMGSYIKDPACPKQKRAFEAAMWSLEHFYGPFDLVCAERFQSRGLKGKTIENINMMLGIMGTVYRDVQLYTASTWKNAYNRIQSLDDTYQILKEKNAVIKKSLRTHHIHELDSSLMGQYCAAKHYGITPFTHLENRQEHYVNHFMKSLKLTQKV